MKPHWIKTCYLSHRRYWLTVYRDNFMDIQKEIKVHKSSAGGIGRVETYYYLDGTRQEFHTEKNLINFLSVVKREYAS